MDSVSPRYLQPTWETPFTLVGVKTSDDAFLAFSHPRKKTYLILCFRDSRFRSDTHLDTSGIRDNRSIVAVENIKLDPNEFSWFVVFRKEKTVAVYRSGELDPFILYQAADDKNNNKNKKARVKDFMKFEYITLASRSVASWDLLGQNYKDQNEGQRPDDPALQHELDQVVKGLTKRRELQQALDLVSALDNNKKSRGARQSAKEIVSSVKPLRVLLKYFNHPDPSRKKLWP